MSQMIGLFLLMALSYVFVFACGWIIRGQEEKQKQEQAIGNRKRWTTYDKEGRIRQ